MIYEFGTFRLDAGKRLFLDVNGNSIPLTPKVFDTLFHLVTNADRLLEKDELMSAVWPDTIVEENNLNKNISILRRLLGESLSDHSFIVTVPGKGYKFVADVREFPTGPAVGPLEEIYKQNGQESAPSDRGISDKRPPDDTTQGDNKRKNRFWFVTVAATMFAGLSFLGLYILSEKNVDAPITSVAVLPFVNTGDNDEFGYLSDGLSEALIDRLSELPQLKVIARSSSFKYRDENADLRDVAQKLGVQSIITGRVTRRGDDLVIRVDLMDARNNEQLWGEQFSRNVSNAQTIGGEIARKVSERLRLKLSGIQVRQLSRRGTDNPEAFDLLLKGDFLSKSAATRRKALESYAQAVRLDPNFALAHARLALVYLSLASSNIFDPKTVLPDIESAAQKSIELDENLADAHHVLAELARDRWDWTAAEHEYQRALELNPNLIAAHTRYTSFLSDLGRHEEAISEARRVKELDPEQLSSHLAFPLALISARRFDESIVEIKKTMEMGQMFGSYALLGNAYAGMGMHAESATAFKEAIRLGSKEPYHLICLGASLARSGDNLKARMILKEFETSMEYVSPGELAILYAALGDREKALTSLENAYTAHDIQLQHLRADPGYDSMRGEPRFQNIVRRVGLPL